MTSTARPRGPRLPRPDPDVRPADVPRVGCDARAAARLGDRRRRAVARPARPAIGAGLTFAVFRMRLAPLLPDAVPRRQLVAHLVLALCAGLLYAGVLVVVLLLQGEPLEGIHSVAGVPFVLLLLTYLVGAAARRSAGAGCSSRCSRTASLLVASIVTGLVWACGTCRSSRPGPS
ncbi:hypothetical protein NKG05_15655 [Oerskovia sp. M15]